MKAIRIGASQARNDFFNMLLAVREGQVFDITYKDEVVAVVKKKKKKQFDWGKYKKNLKKWDKILAKSDWSDLEQVRKDFNKKRFPEW
ncbi:hypothetical protein KKC08_05600 [Patescibacteria group bacterium]|nr:hypothetical protein [Patescibacteria group bacterium]MCG2701536.1 hypothetical protein [Candidatus Parcubacteria bacterium]MBU4210468.1 hypothetical protein [Patescibacteria group bacterium]MBU4265261.1 hypothetical protein [Patescibacteria group bacterium]MBU4389946.1 hypothetical protein [Patescibacteria group bacterium]